MESDLNLRKKFLFCLLTLSAIFISGCAANNLESKTIAVKQPLNQVFEIGAIKGSIAPDFAVITTEGKVIVLGDFARNNKPAIVYFFATWCHYCHEDLLALSKVYDKYKNNVSIVAVSLDLSEEPKKIRKYKTNYPQLQSAFFAPGTNDILTKYQVIRTTAKFAVNRNGTVIYSGFGAFDEDQWKILLEALSK